MTITLARESDKMNRVRNLISHSERRADQQVVIEQAMNRQAAPTAFDLSEVNGTILTRFERIAAQLPERTAVVDGSQTISYQCLRQQANGIATAIGSIGKSDGPLGVLLPSGAELIATFLAVWKAGRYFVLLDPGFPDARLEYVLTEAGVESILTGPQYQRRAQSLLTGARVLDVTECGLTADEPIGSGDLRANDVSLVVYTSGSTGQPKGATHTHRSLLHHAWRFGQILRPTCEDGFGWLTSGTSNALFNSILPLLYGATVYRFDARESSLDSLDDWLRTHAITVLPIGVTLFRRLAEVAEPKGPYRDLRVLRLTSDTVRPADVNTYKKLTSTRCMLINSLNSSETASVCAYVMSHESALAPEETVPLGYPVADIEVLLLDEQGQSVPVGEIGEIVIRSRYLSLGYWKQPELTASKFIADNELGFVRYHTGDLGQTNADGALCLLGRRDHRVKIRGYGVDLNEVQRVIAEHPVVRETIVTVSQDAQSEPRLVAYVATREPLDVSALVGYLGERIPSYMVPWRFVPIQKLPIGPHGKVDRQQLPPPGSSRPTLRVPEVVPRTSTEQRVARIWSSILSVEPIGIDDDFRDLGGDSITAAHLVVSLSREFDRPLPNSVLLEMSTVRELAARIDSGESTVRGPLVPVRTAGDRTPLFVVHATDCYPALRRLVAPEQPIFGLAEHFNGDRVRFRNLTDLAAHYLASVRTVQPRGPYLLTGHSIGGTIAFEMACQLRQDGEEVALLAILDSGPPREKRESLPHLREVYWRIRELVGTKELSRTAKRWGRELGKRLQCRWAHWRGRRLAPELREFYTDNVVYRTIYTRAKTRHEPTRYAGPILYFMADENRRERLEAWRQLALGTFDVVPVPGDHHSMLEDPNIRVLVERLFTRVGWAQQARSGAVSPPKVARADS
ncbi:MAG: alpha/beta fold hydrolase [Pseudomonadota bacterium]